MRGTATYAAVARDIAEEVRSTAESDPGAVEACIEAVRSMTAVEWLRFRASAEDEIRGFASATPSRRRRRRGPTSPLVYLAAYQYCLEAAVLLQEIDPIETGDSYRGALATAGGAVRRIWDALCEIQLQDFDGEPCPFRRRADRS